MTTLDQEHDDNRDNHITVMGDTHNTVTKTKILTQTVTRHQCHVVTGFHQSGLGLEFGLGLGLEFGLGLELGL